MITIALSSKKGKVSIILIISPGKEWEVSKNKKSNFRFNYSKNLCGCSPLYNFHLFFNSGNSFVL